MRSQVVSNASAQSLQYGSPFIICQKCGTQSLTGKIYWEMMTESEKIDFEATLMKATMPNSLGYSLMPGLAVGFILNESYHLSPMLSFLGGVIATVLIMVWLIPRKRKQKIEFMHWFKHWVPDEVKAVDATQPGYREQLKLRSFSGTQSIV